MKSNQNSATEDQVGELHKAVTEGYKRIITSMVDNYDKALGSDDPKVREEAQFMLDSRDLNAAAKWVSMNGIGSLAEAEREGSKLKQALDKIKSKHHNNVIDFTDKVVNE
jgi:hypothetical protein